jgi:hypothetical protein
MKQTAVDWFFDNLKNHEVQAEHFSIYEQAKEMEKEQIMEAHYAPKYGCFSDEYYSETFNTKEK